MLSNILAFVGLPGFWEWLVLLTVFFVAFVIPSAIAVVFMIYAVKSKKKIQILEEKLKMANKETKKVESKVRE